MLRRANAIAAVVAVVAGCCVASNSAAPTPIPATMTKALITVALIPLLAAIFQTSAGCKNCVSVGKEEKAMFRAHSSSCAATSGVHPTIVARLLGGELPDDPALRAYIYCVLLKCKLIGKDGKLHKAALLGKLAAHGDAGAKNATKVIETCAEQDGATPEERAWNLFRCGYDKKAVLFEYLPTLTSHDDNVEEA